MPNIRGPELLVLVLVIVLLFGAKRLPDAARSVGRSLRIFKAETKGLTGSEEPDPTQAALPESAPRDVSPETTQAQQTIPPAPPVPPSQA